jgi:hypothetical protein
MPHLFLFLQKVANVYELWYVEANRSFEGVCDLVAMPLCWVLILPTLAKLCLGLVLVVRLAAIRTPILRRCWLPCRGFVSFLSITKICQPGLCDGLM